MTAPAMRGTTRTGSGPVSRATRAASPGRRSDWGSWECTGCGAVYRVRRKKPAPCKQWWWVHPEGAPSYTEHCGGDWRRVDEDAYGPLPAADPEAEPEEPTMAEREAAGQEVLL